jgi:predicted DNA-binding transcriptional regulator AlpA
MGMITNKETAKRLGIKPRTLDRWRVDNKGPAWTKVGFAVRYSTEDVEMWLASRRFNPEEVTA